MKAAIAADPKRYLLIVLAALMVCLAAGVRLTQKNEPFAEVAPSPEQNIADRRSAEDYAARNPATAAYGSKVIGIQKQLKREKRTRLSQEEARQIFDGLNDPKVLSFARLDGYGLLDEAVKADEFPASQREEAFRKGVEGLRSTDDQGYPVGLLRMSSMGLLVHLKDQRAVSHLRPFLNDPDKLCRKVAKEALKRLEKSAH